MPSQKVTFSAPSNIAFVKYWGKFGRQYPVNPSISMTLKNCLTNCEVEWSTELKDKGIQSFLFEGKENNPFKERLQNYLDSIIDIYPLSEKLTLFIKSENTFPHSAGIASSASAMAAFASCLVEIENELGLLKDDFKERVSILSRLASGSACRSVYENYVVWGETQFGIGSNDFAIDYKNVDEKFTEMCDSILIVSGKEKSVSSSLGHSLMNSHVYKDTRTLQANDNMRSITTAISNGDFETFGEILENEALTLHALMMTSYPSFILLEPNSLKLIQLIKKYRVECDIPMYFTIDAGPNIHLLYPKKYKKQVINLIQNEFNEFFESVIHDEIGTGIKKL